jgi:hypothetical protein
MIIKVEGGLRVGQIECLFRKGIYLNRKLSNPCSELHLSSLAPDLYYIEIFQLSEPHRDNARVKNTELL